MTDEERRKLFDQIDARMEATLHAFGDILPFLEGATWPPDPNWRVEPEWGMIDGKQRRLRPPGGVGARHPSQIAINLTLDMMPVRGIHASFSHPMISLTEDMMKFILRQVFPNREFMEHSMGIHFVWLGPRKLPIYHFLSLFPAGSEDYIKSEQCVLKRD